MTLESNESLIKFPCDFTLKIVGRTAGSFEKTAIDIVREYFPALKDSAIQKKASKESQYMSLSVTVHANSKPELDALYVALTSAPEVLMVL